MKKIYHIIVVTLVMLLLAASPAFADGWCSKGDHYHDDHKTLHDFQYGYTAPVYVIRKWRVYKYYGHLWHLDHIVKARCGTVTHA